ncbi:hypothetical protein FRC17_007392 [Serendipita sp. 399]|nr:hypothetical protein FRC17_007392 [Serendipita sp. 399]
MESYKANLRERLDQFQKDFDESTLRRIHSEERRSRMALTPYMDEFGKEVSPRFAPRPRSEESRRGFFGRKKEPKSERLEDEVERALA